MATEVRGRRRGARLFAVYAISSLIPVVILGLVLATTYRAEANRSGLSEAHRQAALLADDVVSPAIGDRPLVGTVPSAAAPILVAAFARAHESDQLLRLRVRDMSGAVVWSDDGSGRSAAPVEDEVIDALHGEVTTSLTNLNADSNDVGPLGPRVAEVYQPLYSADRRTTVGVLEAYVPYAPIQRDVASGVHRMYALLTGGLSVLWLVLFVISMSTTTRLRRQGEHLARVAHYDPASGLLNRSGFREAVQARLDREPNVVPRVALLDIARFREINDAFGRPSGDEVLIEIGRRFVGAVSTDAVVARIGGTEFAIAEFASEEVDVREWAAQLQSFVSEPVETAGVPIHIDVAVGYDRPPVGSSADAVLVRADSALARAKHTVDSCSPFVARPEGVDAARLALLPRFRRALAADGLELFYQPKTSLHDGRVVAVEALLRWRLDGELLLPGAFLGAVEQTALMRPLTHWVARTALAQLGDWGWRADDIDVAINVSAHDLSDLSFAAALLATVAAAQIAPSRLTVEITETALVDDPDAARACLQVLHDAGVTLSIDDFGQGQTSLASLAGLPIDELKIDRGFVSRVTEPAHAAIVSSVIELGHALGLRVVAEGVEEVAQYRAVASLGADITQGFLVARPMPASEFLDWLSAYEPREAVVRLVR